MDDELSPDAVFAFNASQDAFSRAMEAFAERDVAEHRFYCDAHRGWAYVYHRHAHNLTLQ